ncbi:MAG TPA: zinc-dependent metalloprotease, partial [bacterium]|nr:zinc-dependent metalloprotease [bacterium]
VFSKVNRDVVGKRDYDLATRTFMWKKGAKDSGFRPLEFTDELFREYGYFTNKFKGYDNYHGYRDDNYHVLANYWNSAWATEKKEWNFKCGADEDFNTCLKKVKYQQKVVYVSSPKTPLRILPINCAITKDFNHALLAARYAAMKPGSDTREFEKWYMDNYKNDFFTEENGVKIRDNYWYLGDLTNVKWEDKCFVPEQYAWIQRWDGSFIDENEDGSINEDVAKALDEYKNDMVVLVKNPVESFVPARDGKSLYGYANYYNLSSDSRENAIKICVNPEEAALYKEDKVMHFDSCVTNNEEMTKLYVDGAGNAEWRGDRWDCKIYGENDPCPDGKTEVKAACVLNEERTCEVEGGYPVLRHKYDNGNAAAALINWVDKPTDYGILGVSQWNVNPETGQSVAGGSNIAGSVLAWATERAVEMARMVISKDDPAAWDFEDLLNPDYSKYPEVAWNNKPDTYQTKSVIKNDRMKNSMRMINKPMPTLNPNLPIERQGGALKEYIDMFQAKTQKYDKFDFGGIKGTKWESEMVPYSIKKALFPWADPADSPSYSDAEKDIMSPWYGGPALLEAEMLRWIDSRALDFDYDESFLDGTIINFIKAKQLALRGQISDWNDGKTGSAKYEKALIYSIYDELEKLMFKGVAQHEMGHTMGLRHNFAGSTDINNYGDEYFATRNYPTMMAGVEALVKEESAKADYDPTTIGTKVYKYKKNFGSDIGYFTYNSVMDYQREAYIHASGLGKYDKAAFKAVYGRSIEEYAVTGGEKYGLIVKEGDSNDPHPELINKVRDPLYPDFVKINTPYIYDDVISDDACKSDSECSYNYVCDLSIKKCRTKAGELIKVEKPREVVEYYENGEKVTRMVPRLERTMLGAILKDTNNSVRFKHDCDGQDPDQYYCEGDTTYLVNDGSHYKYVFISD